MPKIKLTYKQGGSVSPSKAKEILHDGTIRGKKITEKQRKFFGAMSNKAEDGASVEQLSENPYSNPIVQFNGPSHEEGGIPMLINEQSIEVEGQETAYTAVDGSVNILGNLTVPGTKMKFKTAGKKIAEAENKASKQLDKGIQLINASNPYDRFERLTFNSGNMKAVGAQMKQKELTAIKEKLSETQDEILQAAEILGIKPEKLTAKKGIKIPKMAQEGQTVPPNSYTPFPLRGRSPLPNQTQFVESFFNPIGQMSTSPSTGPGDDEFNRRLKQAIGSAESSGIYTASPNVKGATAYGKYQFTKPTLKGIYDRFYKNSYESFEDFNNQYRSNPTIQEQVMSTRLNDLRQKYGDDPQRIALVHRLGEGGANQALKNPSILSKPIGRSDSPTDKETPNQYLNKIGRVFGQNIQADINPPGINLREVEIIGRRTPPPITPSIDFTTPVPDPMAPQAPTPVVEPPTSTTTTGFTTRPATKRAPFKNPLRFGQIAPEILTIATERAEFVPGQRYEPNLYQPYQVSFQDRLNENQASFNAIGRQLARNPEALSSLAARKYQADNQVLAEEFRTNQGITNEVTNKNIALLNQAQLTNLELNDQQFVRQEQARANTRQNIRNAVQSISDKIQANRAETMDFNLAQNLFPQYTFDQTGQVQFIPNEGLQIGAQIASSPSPYQSSRTTYGATGTPQKTTVTTPSPIQQQEMDMKSFFEQQKKRRSLFDPQLFTK